MARTDRNRRYYLAHRVRILAAKAASDDERRSAISAYNASYYASRKAGGGFKLRRPVTRQEWLDVAFAEAKNILAQHGAAVPDAFSISFAAGPSRLAGRCFGRRIEIFDQEEGTVELLGTVLHEAVHAALADAPAANYHVQDLEDDEAWVKSVLREIREEGMRISHGLNFRHLAGACGLIKPWRATTCGPELRERFQRWIAAHGDVPSR